jgi:dienelactone hydrolase
MVRRHFVIALATSIVFGRHAAAQPANREHVSFKTVDGSVSKGIPATVFHPKGAGPFPALVALHGCDGPNDSNPWLTWLEAQGYLVIESNSLAPRGLTSVCSSGGLSFATQALDALAALGYLRSRPDVIPTKVGVIGWSHGGAAALIASTPRFIRTNRPTGGPFQAAISFYPACRPFRAQNLAAPLLLLLGSADDWPYGLVHLRYDAAATADAHRRVEAFLTMYLH